jgi:predicted phosphodiesterase
MTAKQMIVDYCNKYPDLPTRAMAKVISEQMGFSFDSVRVEIMRHRKKIQQKPTTLEYKDLQKLYKLDSVKICQPDYVFPYKKALVLSDIHIPFHDYDALLAAIMYGKQQGVDSVYLNGDTLDFYQASNFTKSGSMMSVREEIALFHDFIGILNDILGVPIVFKVGNHEERMDVYILRNAPILEEFEEVGLKRLLKLNELGIEFVTGRQKTYMGKLLVVHNHEAGRSVFAPVNPARGMFLRYKCDSLGGHHHQSSEHFESNLRGELIGCFSTGCLCQMTPEYSPFAFTKWNHGFAIVEVFEDGNYKVENKRIVNGTVY